MAGAPPARIERLGQLQAQAPAGAARESLARLVAEVEAAGQAAPAGTESIERALAELAAAAPEVFNQVVAALTDEALGAAPNVRAAAQSARGQKRQYDALSAPGDA